jgi:hypothetical protein
MMSALKFSVALLASASLGTAAFGQNPVGNWRGRAQIVEPQIRVKLNETQSQHVRQMIAQYQKMVVVLNLRADKTFNWTAFGAPTFVNSHKMTGAWEQTGKTVTLTFHKGPHADTAVKITATIGKDGNTLDSMGDSGERILFSRG